VHIWFKLRKVILELLDQFIHGFKGNFVAGILL